MKRFLSVVMILALVFAMSAVALEATEELDITIAKGHQKSDVQKVFGKELNDEKQEAASEKNDLKKQIADLRAEYDALLEAGDTAGAEAKLSEITELETEMEALTARIREINAERFMIAKTLYTDEELQEFESAADLIEQMYEDANALDAGCVTVRDNIIKFDAPPYIKGGRTVVPVRAITEGLGAEVTWDPDTRTITIVKDSITVALEIGTATVTVNGVETDIGVKTEICSSRTYVPLRFLAETFGLDVEWDSEDETIDIDDAEDEEEADEEEADEAEDDEEDTDTEDDAEE